MNKAMLREFMDARHNMVLSTVDGEGRSESAVVGFGATNKLQLVFGTAGSTRKAQNIATNKDVSVVIGWDNQGTIQYEGTARLLGGNDVDVYAEFYFLKNEGARAYKDAPNESYFLIEPRWLRFTDTTRHPWEISEIEF
ncbi:MAG: pyridoxamine 5'-phosphate oxidase family protein [Candidatus Saccharimonadales bacterium]